jgi:hypothetical protein
LNMRSNLEKWNYYLEIINSRTKEFIDSQKQGKIIPEKYYVVYPSGKIAETTIIDVGYSHYNHNCQTFFTGKKPTKEDVDKIAKYAMGEIPFSIDNIYFEYSQIWDKEKNMSCRSRIKFNDVINRNGLFYSLPDAKIFSNKVIEENRIEKEFKEQHAKDANYDYSANGYKFLGWQNAWKHEYYDEDNNLCSETGKPQKSFGYSKKEYPEYRNCIDSGHRRIEVRHNQRGSENTVSCPICKIYWKYDCSD